MRLAMIGLGRIGINMAKHAVIEPGSFTHTSQGHGDQKQFNTWKKPIELMDLLFKGLSLC